MMDNNQKEWTEEELRAAVEVYAQMRHKVAMGVGFSKLDYYKELSERFGRTPKSFEYRMQNISYAYMQLGREWVTGLKPASNVGTKKLAELNQLIEAIDPVTGSGDEQFEKQVSRLLKLGKIEKPAGKKNPEQRIQETKVTMRDPLVKTYVLQQSQGKCENCDAKAPFVLDDGRPYLEVHHIKHLANGGSDTVENAVALCPNCHRAFHYSENKYSLVNALYMKISRLARE